MYFVWIGSVVLMTETVVTYRVSVVVSGKRRKRQAEPDFLGVDNIEMDTTYQPNVSKANRIYV